MMRANGLAGAYIYDALGARVTKSAGLDTTPVERSGQAATARCEAGYVPLRTARRSKSLIL